MTGSVLVCHRCRASFVVRAEIARTATVGKRHRGLSCGRFLSVEVRSATLVVATADTTITVTPGSQHAVEGLRLFEASQGARSQFNSSEKVVHDATLQRKFVYANGGERRSKMVPATKFHAEDTKGYDKAATCWYSS
jgi:hypothetical protein